MVSAMDWNPYSKASVCCGQGRGESQSHVPAATPSPCPNNHSDPAAEVMDVDKGGQLHSPQAHQASGGRICSPQMAPGDKKAAF